ncbi:MAG: nicotinamide-nucleotide amidohydrolase family protein [Frankiaceae bacterium]|jgi:nicotinamide-nucleotide amidase|nr:nicotinamide-nucleotide amidohydrolase family protein [Frankiaceae bacterium]
MSCRAGIVVTGTEVLTGRVADRNGPWLAEQLRLAGADIAQILIVGDRPNDMRAALRFLIDARLDLIITSGGLGPTADDLTAQSVAEVQGRPLRHDPALDARIGEIVARLSASRGWRPDPAATAAATAKQAMVPEGAAVLGPVGTAPGLVVPPGPGRDGPPVLVLPGPPRELQGMWGEALAAPAVRAALAGARELRQSTMRIWNIPESQLSATMRAHDAELSGLEITTCLRDAELEVVTRYAPDQQGAHDRFAAIIEAAYGERAFSLDGRTVDDIVADALIARGATIGAAEALAGATVIGRMLDRPGASAYLRGGVVPYANYPKRELLDVPADLLREFGAVSPQAALALADGARTRLHTDVGVGITGMAGPGGGSAAKPVGLVYRAVVGEGPGGEPGSGARRVIERQLTLPGARADIGARAVAIAMHMRRELLR